MRTDRGAGWQNKIKLLLSEGSTTDAELKAELRQAQKMDSVGQLAAGVAHDFNNLLTIIQGHAGLLLSAGSPDPLARESVRQISLAAERAANLTRQLLMFIRKQTMQPRLLDLNEAIANIFKMLRALAGDQVTIRRNLAANLPPIHADPGMLEQVLVNLAVNARDAMPKGGLLQIETFHAEIAPAHVQRQPESRPGLFVGLSVSDSGHGMDAQTLERIFEPFFTTKQPGQGTGLGLAMVYGIVKQHQGWIEVQSQLGKGSTFKVFLPASSNARPAPDPAHPGSAPGGHETILLVEDEASLRDLVQEVLRKKGYTVLTAATGRRALQLWEKHKAKIDLLLTDMMMPEGVSGHELAALVLADKPALRVIYSSGYGVEVVGPGFELVEGANYLQKPYHPENLAHVVRKRLDSDQSNP
jgi:nitrogen-specific signal transduction histidine kinase/ActR/RegA family two-component response regulator